MKSFDYPEYYGGSYINDEGDLIILIVGDKNTCDLQVKKVLEEEEYYLKQVSCSMKELLQVKEEIEAVHLDGNCDVFNNIPAYGIDDMANCVFVEMEELNKDKIHNFKLQVSNSSLIMFRQGNFSVPEVTVRPGGPINTVAGNSSLGFRVQSTASLDTRNGFVMSGHGTTANLNVVRNNNSSGTTIGTVARRQVSGSVDAAFVTSGSGTTVSNSILQNSLTQSTTLSNPALNTTVFLVGRNNLNAARSGTVNSTNLNVTVSGRPMTNMSRASYSSSGGDSGGLIYTHTIPQANVQVAGNHVASNGVFGKANLINAALQVRLR